VATANFALNFGGWHLQTSPLRRRVSQRDWAATTEQQRRVYGGGKFLPRLVVRRKAKAGLAPSFSASRPKYVHFGFQTFAHAKVICPNLKPPARLLIEVEAATDLDNPAIIQTDFAVVNVRVEFHLQLDI
jgi:hypothetical protein